ncbi:MAG TPA: SMP-30/gluconolactonase/LRE family protein [Bryobacteraceae bacterium]
MMLDVKNDKTAPGTRWNRRAFLAASLAGAALPRANAQNVPALSTPTARDWSKQEPLQYPDPDIIAFDNRFRRYILNSPIKRLYTGTLWAEGIAWSGNGRYIVWSDIPNNVQMRWLEEDGHVTVFHRPSGYSNGNTFDYEGRQLSCEHGNRRVARYENNGTISVIADKYQGKRLNSPNDIVVHPDGGIWFTDPSYGIRGYYEGFKGDSEVKPAVYRVDGKTAQMDKVTDELDQPNGICFSPDYKKVYICDTGSGRDIRVYDLDGKSLRNGKQFVVLDMPSEKSSNPKVPNSGGPPSAADGIRCDIDGNIWAGARPGVQVITPAGERIGMIRLPETCANICFGGTKRNRLFMAASQSLYSVYVDTVGAHIA